MAGPMLVAGKQWARTDDHRAKKKNNEAGAVATKTAERFKQHLDPKPSTRIRSI